MSNQRSISIHTLYTYEAGPATTDFDLAQGIVVTTAFDEFDAWRGESPLPADRKDWPQTGEQADISNFEEVVKHLRPIPRDKIYPLFPAQELTEYKPQEGVQIFFKKPNIVHYNDGCDDLSLLLLDEARTQEKLLRNQHPGLGHYLGCVVDGGRIVRLAFPMLKYDLFHRIWNQTAGEFPERQRLDCVERIEQAARHLHYMGLAHNDISPANIMFDGTGAAVLIDLDGCLPVGARIVKGGLVAGWKGPLHDNGRVFKESSIELDELAIEEIRAYLAKDLAKKIQQGSPTQ